MIGKNFKNIIYKTGVCVYNAKKNVRIYEIWRFYKFLHIRFSWINIICFYLLYFP